MLGDVDSDVRRVAAQALAKLGEPKWQEIIKGDESDRANQSADVIEPLLRALGDSGMLARYRHLRNTGQWRDSDGGLLILELTRQRM
jgi:HEAT repeat protein